MNLHTMFFVGGLIVLTAACFIALKWIAKKENSPEAIKERKRTDDLVNDARNRYPRTQLVQAVGQYIEDIEDQISTLKKNSLNTDVLFIVQNLTDDLRLLREYYANLLHIEVELQSGFNLFT